MPPSTSMTVLIGFVLLYALMSLATFFVYGWDKRQAGRSGRRIPEKTLHLLELFFGWPGAVVARTVFRHKRRKLGFSIITALIALLHIAVWCAIYFL